MYSYIYVQRYLCIAISLYSYSYIGCVAPQRSSLIACTQGGGRNIN